MHHRQLHEEERRILDPLELPTTSGRLLAVGGFVLGDDFETFLRQISEEYLAAAWTNLSAVLERHPVVCDDLSWGMMHPGETEVGYPHRNFSWVPSDFIGWTSEPLSEIWRGEEYLRWDNELKARTPSLRCTATWRSLKWNIAPTDFSTALILIEHLCTDEIAPWHPDVVLEYAAEPQYLWHRLAHAIEADDQADVNALVEEARHIYSPIGYRILLRGFGLYLDGWRDSHTVTLPLPD